MNNSCRKRRERGFTLIELIITVAIVAILAAVAFPSYTRYLVRASRESAQTELLQLANLQEKIYLNSNSYTASVTGAYNGKSDGGLGRTSGKTSDSKYSLALTPAAPGQSYTLTATPVAGTPQATDGAISIDSTGQRLRGTVPW